ncbi:MAG: LysE family transporter [Rhizobiaceae bacterium]
MDIQIVSGIFVLAFVAMITPGPNNLVVLTLALGGDFGRVTGACGGIIAGMVGLTIVCWYGAASIFDVFPLLRIIVVALGSAYLMWGGAMLIVGAWRGDQRTKQVFPSSFLALAGFQFTNPKAWVLCLAAVSAMQGNQLNLFGLGVLTLILAAASAISLAAWIIVGHVLPVARDGEGLPAWVGTVLGLALIGTSASLALSVI